MATSSPSLITNPTSSKAKQYLSSSKPCSRVAANHALTRRHFLGTVLTTGLMGSLVLRVEPSLASVDDEYVKESTEVISKVRNTVNMDKKDPNIAEAVAQLRELSNTWVSKYRREKASLGRPSFRDIYSALNAVSGHYISFGPTAPIPVKRKQRILEEVDTAEKALLRGR